MMQSLRNRQIYIAWILAEKYKITVLPYATISMVLENTDRVQLKRNSVRIG